MPTLDLMNALKIAAGSPFTLDYGQETSGQAGGQIRTREIRAPLWRLRWQSARLSLARLAEIEAEISRLGGSLRSFYAFDPTRPFPAADPDGAILGEAGVAIHAMADATHIRLAGLPEGYRISNGDLFAFDYGTPARRALHRFAETVTADGDGLTASAEVVPPIRAGAETGLAVNLKRPAAEMVIVPGSYEPSAARTSSAVSLSAIQVI